MNCDFCGTDTGINGMDLKDGGHSHYSSSSCAQSLKEQRERLLLQIGDMKNSMEDINKALKHHGLEPWTDGRSVYDGKRPWEQHIQMVLISLKCRADVAERLNDELRERLTNVKWETQDELLAYWNKAFEKYGLHLHPGLTPEQNVEEMVAKLKQRKCEMVDSRACGCPLCHPQKQQTERPIGEAFAGTPEHLQPRGGSCTCGAIGYTDHHPGCALYAEKRQVRP